MLALWAKICQKKLGADLIKSDDNVLFSLDTNKYYILVNRNQQFLKSFVNLQLCVLKLQTLQRYTIKSCSYIAKSNAFSFGKSSKRGSGMIFTKSIPKNGKYGVFESLDWASKYETDTSEIPDNDKFGETS